MFKKKVFLKFMKCDIQRMFHTVVCKINSIVSRLDTLCITLGIFAYPRRQADVISVLNTIKPGLVCHIDPPRKPGSGLTLNLN